MDYPKSEKVRLIDWTNKLGDEITKCESENKVLEKELIDLKIEHNVTESKLEIIEDIDDRESREFVCSIYKKEFIEEQKGLEREINVRAEKITNNEERIKANILIINNSNLQ